MPRELEIPQPLPKPSEAPAAISALPEMTALQIAEEKLEAAAGECRRLDHERQTLKLALAGETDRAERLLKRLNEIESNPFLFAVSNMDSGTVLKDAGDELVRVTAACQKLNEKGSITLKIALKPLKGVFILIPEITTKIPKPDAPHSIFYADAEGKLSRKDPRQKEMDFTKSDGGRGAVGDPDAWKDEAGA